VDGVSVNDYSNGPPGSVMGGTLGVDAIQEFSVLTSNFSAEYGKSSGGVINGISRSGTNAFHGSVYEFLRNSALDAPGYFEGAPRHHSSETSLAFRLAAPFARIARLSSATMKEYASRRESLT